MTEIPGGPARRPLDVFDSTADGFAPHTLEQTEQAARDVVQALERFDLALKGCATPLQLGSLRGQGRAARIRAGVWVEELKTARDIIELDLPISDTFPRDDLAFLDLEEPEPWNREGGLETLTPAAVIQLRGHTADLPIDRLTSYRREIEKRNPVPAIIRNRRGREMHRAWRASFTDEAYAALWAEGRPARLRSYREFMVAAGSAGPDLVEGVAVRVNREANLAGNE